MIVMMIIIVMMTIVVVSLNADEPYHQLGSTATSQISTMASAEEILMSLKYLNTSAVQYHYHNHKHSGWFIIILTKIIGIILLNEERQKCPVANCSSDYTPSICELSKQANSWTCSNKQQNPSHSTTYPTKHPANPRIQPVKGRMAVLSSKSDDKLLLQTIQMIQTSKGSK